MTKVGESSQPKVMADDRPDTSTDAPEPTESATSLAARMATGGRMPTWPHFCVDCLCLVASPSAQCPECDRLPPTGNWPALSACDDRWLGCTVDGSYLIDKRLGNGSTASIYRAVSLTVPRQFALKVVDAQGGAEGERIQESLRREIEAQSCATNPHVVHLFDVFDLADEHLGILMDLVDGETLYDLIVRHGPVAPRRACELLRQAAVGIHETHQSGLIHRDLKPQNMMVESLPSGEDFVRVLDFGIACLQHEHDVMGGFVGTPAYASPEQVACETLDPRSDIYSLGAVLVFMLTGRPPFRGDSVAEVLKAHLSEPAPALEDICPGIDIDEQLEALVARMLAKQRSARPSSLAQLIAEIDGLLAEGLLSEAAHVGHSGGLAERSDAETIDAVRDEIDAGVDESSSDMTDTSAGVIAPRWSASPLRIISIPTSAAGRPWALTDDARLVYLSERGDLKLIDPRLGSEWAQQTDVDDSLTALALNGQIALLGTKGGRLFEFDMREGTSRLEAAYRPRSPVISVATSDSGRALAVALAAGAVRWRADAVGRSEWHDLDRSDAIQQVCLSADSRQLAVRTNLSFSVWTLGQTPEMVTTVSLSFGVEAIAFDRVGSHLACVTGHQEVGLYDLQADRWSNVISTGEEIVGIASSPEGGFVVVAEAA